MVWSGGAECCVFSVSVHSGMFCDVPWGRFLGTKLGTPHPAKLLRALGTVRTTCQDF
jgi:hypothetical protein